MEEDEEILRGAMSQSELDLSCSIKCAASDISLTEALLSPLHDVSFLLRWGTVCKSPQCNIMGPKDNHTCATLQCPNINCICFRQLRWRKTATVETSTQEYLVFASIHPKRPPVQSPVKVGHFLANVFLTITQMYSHQFCFSKLNLVRVNSFEKAKITH